MDREHSRIIIFLLAGIFAVLLFGREAIASSFENLFWIALVLGIVILLVTGAIALFRYLGREVTEYRAEVRSYREAGKPWLHMYVAWPGIIGNFLVFGIAAYSRYVDESCKALVGDCLQQIPYWWAPVCLVLGSFPIGWLEAIVLRFRNRGGET